MDELEIHKIFSEEHEIFPDESNDLDDENDDFGRWNYRVVKHGEEYKIAEVFYNKNGDISGWADVSDHCLIWETYKEIKGTYDLIKHAFEKPVLAVLEGDELKEIIEGDSLVMVAEIPEPEKSIANCSSKESEDMIEKNLSIVQTSIDSDLIEGSNSVTLTNSIVTAWNNGSNPQCVPDKKVKRCYVLTEQEIEKLMLLKAKIYKDKDLSEIIGKSIDLLYDKTFS